MKPNPIAAAAALGCWAITLAPPAADAAALASIHTTLVDSDPKGYGTFQSHNQKIVANARGIFMAYDHFTDPAGPNVWRLARSVDRGKSFTTIYEGKHGTRAPVLETDAAGNLYLAHPDFGWKGSPRRTFCFYRFLAADDYREPRISTFPKIHCDAKYAMVYDAPRSRFYIATQYGRLLTVSMDGALERNVRVWIQNGPNASTQYPLLHLDETGCLHHGQTTTRSGVSTYRSIQYIRSPDGGLAWETMDGSRLAIPVVPDETGPTDMICLPDELDVRTWLAGLFAKAGKVHFMYYADRPLHRRHYVRFDLRTGRRDRDTWPAHPKGRWLGETISLRGSGGLFASKAGQPDSPLYAVKQHADGRLACLVTRDNGQTWRDFAMSADPYDVYALGGCREVTDDGFIIGSFTGSKLGRGPKQIWFFMIPTQAAPAGAPARR